MISFQFKSAFFIKMLFFSVLALTATTFTKVSLHFKFSPLNFFYNYMKHWNNASAAVYFNDKNVNKNWSFISKWIWILILMKLNKLNLFMISFFNCFCFFYYFFIFFLFSIFYLLLFSSFFLFLSSFLFICRRVFYLFWLKIWKNYSINFLTSFTFILL